MYFIDPHAHMVSRSTDDYQRMALSGCLALSEPAFWAGYDHIHVAACEDYFRKLTDFEPKRAAQYGIAHHTWLCLSPKEGENRELSAEVLSLIPNYLSRPNVIGIGEIGLNRVTRNELATFEDHLELAQEHSQLILIHTPHLEDKYKGTRVTLDTLRRDSRTKPERVLIDHAEEHTIEMILEESYWCGITLYPTTKVSPERAIDMIEQHGPDRICVNSACDWGPSNPLAVPEFILAMRRRGHTEALIKQIVFENPLHFLSQSEKFRLPREL